MQMQFHLEPEFLFCSGMHWLGWAVLGWAALGLLGWLKLGWQTKPNGASPWTLGRSVASIHPETTWRPHKIGLG